MDNPAASLKAVLHVALQDGFDDEPVAVLVNDEEVYRRADVKTDYRISLADSFEIPLPASPFVVTVRLPARSLTDSVTVEADATIYVGVSCRDGALLFRTSDRPFGYL